MKAGQNSVGVVVPTYNRVGALMKCLAHLEHQSCMDFEVVVVDDGSMDATPARMASYLQSAPFAIRYLRRENGGPARARNQAISIIEAPICLMIGDDIFASEGLVEAHLRLHQQRPEEQVAALGLTSWSTVDQEVTPFMRWLERGA